MKDIRTLGTWKSYNQLVQEKAQAENVTVNYVFRKGWVIQSSEISGNKIFAYLSLGKLIFCD